MSWEDVLKRKKVVDGFYTSGENEARRRAFKSLKNKYPTYPTFYNEKERKQFNKELKRKIREEMKKVRREGYTMSLPAHRQPRGKTRPRDSKKVRDAQRDKREQEEAFGDVTDSPSYEQPQPKANQQRKRKKVGFGMAGNKTNPMPRKARMKARNRPYNPFSGEGRQVGKKKHHHKYLGDKK